MTDSFTDLAAFGWSQHFQLQLNAGDDRLKAARVGAVHRTGIDVMAPGLEARATFRSSNEEDQPTVGDWVLVEPATLRVERVLARRSLFKRRAAGTGHRTQLLAANVDTVFVVSS